MSEQTTEIVNQNFADFDLSLYGTDELKQILGCISEIVDEASFVLTDEGLTFRGMNPSHVCLIDLSIPNSCFEKWQLTKPGTIALRMDETTKIIKGLDKKDTVRLSHNESCLLSISTKTTNTKLRTIESSSTDQPLPKLSYNSHIAISFKEFKKALKQISVVSEYVTLETIGQKFKLSGIGDSGSNEITFEKGMQEIPELEVKEDTKATYSLEYLLAFLKHLNSGCIELDFSSKMPIRIRVKFWNVASMVFYLAPRVEN